MGRFIRVVVVVLALGMLGLTPAFAASTDRTDVVVVLDDDVRDNRAAAAALGRQYDARVSHVYTHVLDGFAASVPDGRLAALRRDPRVALVEVDGLVQATAQDVTPGVERINAPVAHKAGVVGAVGGTGVAVGILDSGISDHQDLNIVRSLGKDCTGTGTTQDDNGHGTHVAGTVGAVDNGVGVLGVAPATRVVPVKVLNSKGSGQWSWIICGLDHAAATGIPVVNMSLSGSGSWNGVACPGSSSLHMAICDAIKAGTTVVVAAGNNGYDAKNRIPAAYPEVVTVSALEDRNGVADEPPYCATTCEDALASFSNFGQIIDVIAPGVSIQSTTSTTMSSYGSKSGTSMAAPHVAGVVALIVAAHGPMSPAAVRDHLLATGQCPGGVLTLGGACTGGASWPRDPDGVTEPIVDAFLAATTPPGTVTEPDPSSPPSNATPTAAFTSVCDGLTCSFTDLSNDTDGNETIVSRSWTFGDGDTDTPTPGGSTGASHTYAAGGTYTVTLTVTDVAGATGQASTTVTVSAPSTALWLSASGGKSKGDRFATLSWGPVPTSNPGWVDVWRDGDLVATTEHDGGFTQSGLGKGGGSTTYQVCLAGDTSSCSNTVTVVW